MKITSIADYKQVRKLERILIDLTKIEKLLSESIVKLATYKSYTPAKSVLANLMENKALIVVHLKKCKTLLEQYNAIKLEKVSKEHSDENSSRE